MPQLFSISRAIQIVLIPVHARAIRFAPWAFNSRLAQHALPARAYHQIQCARHALRSAKVNQIISQNSPIGLRHIFCNSNNSHPFAQAAGHRTLAVPAPMTGTESISLSSSTAGSSQQLITMASAS